MALCTDLNVGEAVSGIRGVIFDCDGVMVDSFEANKQFYNLFLEKFGLDPMNGDQEMFVHAHPIQESLRHILPQDLHGRIEEVRATVHYKDLLPWLRLEEGLVDLLAFLRRHGFLLAVNTNRTTTMELVLDHFGLRSFFRPVVTAGTVANPKPHPESLHKILEFWGLGPRQVVYLGDSVVDELTAYAAGVPFWAFRNERLSADLYVEDFPGLKGCLARAMAGGATYAPGL